MKLRWILLLIVTTLAVGWCLSPGRWGSVDSLLKEAQTLQKNHQYEQAEKLAIRVLKRSPENSEALMLAAKCAAEQRQFQRMFDYIARIPKGSSHWLQAHFMEAEVQHYQLAHLEQAEAAYRAILDVEADSPEANEGIARLLGLVGRRREAIPHILRLIRQGVETDLLMLIARESSVVTDEELLQRAIQHAPHDPNPLLAQAWHASSEMQTDQSLTLLKQALTRKPGFAATWAAIGKELWAQGKYQELSNWTVDLPVDAETFPEVWQVRASMAEREGNRLVAIRCYWEAVKRGPESKETNSQLARLLSAQGETTQAELFKHRILQLQEFEEVQNKALFSHQQASYAELLALVQHCYRIGRLWEAYAWGQVAFQINPDSTEQLVMWPQLQQQIQSLPLELTAPSMNLGLRIDLSAYPLPKHTPQKSADVVDQMVAREISFRDDSVATGLNFQYFNGAPRDAPQRRMYEFTGGGVAVLDFDMDGFPDVYLTQGAKKFGLNSGEMDHLYRNVQGREFINVNLDSGILERGFGQGVAIGDYNSDGFPDCLVGNIGKNRLWLNQGDGTFSEVADESNLHGNAWTTSCLMADLNGDTHPDLYEVNYLTGSDVYERVCQHSNGSPVMCMPFDFRGATDQLWLNDGSGKFENATDTLLSVTPDGKGLGVLAWDALGDGRLSVLVANDTTPNFFFSPEVKEDQVQLVEQGILSGIALNAQGKAEGSMGIAVADLDQNGLLDVHITNFLTESNTLYSNTSPGFFSDRSDEFGLREFTFSTLGFGTQFLDADLDGVPELFVANGHVDDLRAFDRPYRMQPQFFQWSKHHFRNLDASQLGPFFLKKWLGRAVCRIDWNRDGLEDLIVGQLADPTVLLTNVTPVVGKSLSIRLIGTRSARDAIGTTVQARISGQTLTQQLTGGDGYQASNERRLRFGFGDSEVVEELSIKWPSGEMQLFQNIPLSKNIIVCQGRSDILEEAHSPSPQSKTTDHGKSSTEHLP